MSSVGPGELSRVGKEPVYVPAITSEQTITLVILYVLCALYFIFYKELSHPYHLILPSACEADYRNLIPRRKRDWERLHDLPKDTQQQNGKAKVHTDALWSQAQTISHFIKGASISEGPPEEPMHVAGWKYRTREAFCSKWGRWLWEVQLLLQTLNFDLWVSHSWANSISMRLARI